MQIVATFGVWDLLHIGHLNILKRAKRLGDKLIVGVASDEITAIHKGRIPVIPLEQRMRIVEAIRCVDVTIPYFDLDFTNALGGLDIDILVVGEDWGDLKEHSRIKEYMRKKGRIIVMPYTKDISSAEIRKRFFNRVSRTDSEY